MSLYVGDRVVCRYICIPHCHLRTVTYTRVRIDTIDSPDDEYLGCSKHVENWNTQIYEKESRVKLVIYKDD